MKQQFLANINALWGELLVHIKEQVKTISLEEFFIEFLNGGQVGVLSHGSGHYTGFCINLDSFSLEWGTGGADYGEIYLSVKPIEELKLEYVKRFDRYVFDIKTDVEKALKDFKNLELKIFNFSPSISVKIQIKKPQILIVSRHEATIQWLLEKYPNAEVNRTSVTKEDILEKEVHGNLPNQLACELPYFYAIEFDNFPPRGEELTSADLKQYGIREVKYSVEVL